MSDTWLKAWNAMPPHRPTMLRMFLAKITRNLSFNRFQARNAEKRGGSSVPTEDRTKLICAYHWMIPVNLSEVEAVRIGDVEIPVR